MPGTCRDSIGSTRDCAIAPPDATLISTASAVDVNGPALELAPVMTCVEAQTGGNFKAQKRGSSASRKQGIRLPVGTDFSTPAQEPPLSSTIIDFLLARRSPPIAELSEPGPSDDEIRTLLAAATRVPDHGMLAPWRFILYRGDARIRAGTLLAARAAERDGELSDARRQQELTRFSRAPLVIGVVSSLREHPKIPQW